MNATPKTHAVQVRRAAERRTAVVQDIRRLAFTSETGVIRSQPVAPVEDEADPHCFVCGRHTDHFAEHDDLVEAGKARYGSDGSVYPI